jgi:hypothetical protein
MVSSYGLDCQTRNRYRILIKKHVGNGKFHAREGQDDNIKIDF